MTSVLRPRATAEQAYGIRVKHYNCLPEKNWAVDTAHLASLVDDDTGAILVNNPSNPCGSVLPRQNLQEIADIAARRQLPIIADEIYGNMVFDGHTFFPMAQISTAAPVIQVSAATVRQCSSAVPSR